MKRLPVLLALAGVLALSAIGWAQAAPATATTQHYYANITTDRLGGATVDLQVPVDPADVVVKVASGASNLGGEDPSFATVNFAGFVNTDEDAALEAIRVRVIGWHANTTTGIAEFRYFSNKATRIAVDVYPRTTVPAP